MKLLTNNCGLKLLSLILAGLISAYVVNEVNYPIPEILHLPLVVRGVASDMVLVSSVPPSIRVNVRGPFRLTRRLQGIAPVASLNLQELGEPGSYTVPVQLPDLGQVVVTGQQFNDYVVTLDRRGQVLKKLRIDQHGELSDYFQIGAEVLQPEAVSIKGPASLVESVATAQVEPDLSKLDRRISDKLEPLLERLQVKLYDRDGHLLNQSLLQLEPEMVDYTLTPLPVGAIKVLQVLPEYVGDVEEGYMVESLSPGVLYVKLDSDLVPEGISTLSTSPIDVSRRKDSFSTSASIVYPFELPPGEDVPQECSVQVEIIPIKSAIGAIQALIELQGRKPHLAYSLDVENIDILPEKAVELSESQQAAIRATIDVSQLEAGEYRLSPQLSLPLELASARIQPPTVTLTVRAQEK